MTIFPSSGATTRVLPAVRARLDQKTKNNYRIPTYVKRAAKIASFMVKVLFGVLLLLLLLLLMLCSDLFVSDVLQLTRCLS
jgi:hypothetical protein